MPVLWHAGMKAESYMHRSWSNVHVLGLCACVLLLAHNGAATGLPGQYLLSPRWRMLLSAYSPLTNPALMTERDYISVRSAFCGGPKTAGNLWELGVVVPIGLYQSVGAGLIAESGGDIESGVLDADGNYVPTDGRVSSSNYFGMMSYAINPWGRLSIGANVNVAYQSNFGDSEYGVGGDLGLSYRLMQHPLLGQHVIGLTYQNLVPPDLSVSGDDSYSAQIKANLWSLFWERRIESMIELNLTDFAAKAEQFVAGDRNIEWDVSWVMGGWILRLFNLYGMLSANQDGIRYWAWAIGCNLPTLNGGRDLALAYQFRDEIDVPLRPTHTAYLRMDIGRHREEMLARRYAHELTWMANDLYSKAMELFHRGKYWDSYFVFSEIVVSYPDFFKTDWVTYYRARCLEELDMREASKELYHKALNAYERSDTRPFAELGLMRLHYRDAEYDRIFSLYLSLNRPTVSDSLRHHASYLMGEALYNEGRIRDAVKVLNKVPEYHPEYVFAQHTAAIASFVDEKPLEGRDRLEAAVTAMVNTTPQREMVHRSVVLMGYLYYEHDSLATAVAALRMVPPTSIYYEDALMGLGWAALKAQQWNDAVRVGQELRMRTSHRILECEAIVFEASGKMMLKDYVGALDLLKEGTALARTLQEPSEDTLHARRLGYETERTMYNYLADDIVKYSLRHRTPALAAQIDSVHFKQQRYREGLDNYLTWRDARRRRLYFYRSVGEVRDDMDYLYALARGRAGKVEQYEAVKPILDKQKELDQEIRRLKEQMEELETDQ
ncbi:MAG: tetratricopeptide repeat protein [Chitinivibrionales bacterium]|nr:tetratricopeptide repeat protein [Chitinivibrionales bacterium]